MRQCAPVSEEQSIPVVILGVGLAALGTARRLGRAGLRPYLVAPRGDLATRTRWVKGRVLHIGETADPEALDAGLRQHGVGRRMVLVPCSDEWLEVVSSLVASDPDTYLASVADRDVVELLVDKLRFAEQVERLGVAHPLTIPATSEAALEERDLTGWFLTPRKSQLFSRRYHRKAFTLESPEAAREAYRTLVGAGLEGVLQEYVPGPSSDHYFIDGFVDRQSRVRTMFARRRMRMYPLDYGNSTMMTSVPLSEVQQAADELSRFLTGINYRGVFSAEFKKDQRDGVLRIIEVNARAWWYVEFAADCGVDVTLMAYRDAVGAEVPEQHGYAVGVRCVLLPQDLRAFHALRKARKITWRSWLRSWIGARPAVFAWDDPLPAISLPLFVARRAIRLATAS
jgi:predicted ATP-grasp superfamily ATP-dependent carboligase